MKNASAFAAAFGKAVSAGQAAGQAASPPAMHIRDMQTGQVWREPEGMCGFAWVNVRPGNCPFANWLKKNGHARPSCEGGVQIWISSFNQSVARKEACANAMAEVFRQELGVNAYADSRLD